MTDLISRQAAIDYLMINMNWYNEDGYETDEDEKRGAITDLINGVPFAQPERKWIPLKDREPDKEGEYLVSFHDGFIATTGYYDGDFELWADAGEPIAWMPLPEPYREDKG